MSWLVENGAKFHFVGRLFLVLLQRSFSTTFSGFSFVSVEHLFDWRSRAEALNRPPNRTILGQALQDDNVRRICDSFCRGERLFARDWISGQALRDDSSSRHPDNASGQDPCLSRQTGPKEPIRPYFRQCYYYLSS